MMFWNEWLYAFKYFTEDQEENDVDLSDWKMFVFYSHSHGMSGFTPLNISEEAEYFKKKTM